MPAAVARAAAGPEVARVAPPVASTDGRSSYLAITLRDGADADPVVERLEDRPGVLLGGPEVIGEQAGTQVQEDLARAELLAFPLLFIVSLFVFRGVVAALLPLAVGMVTVLSTFLMMRGANAIEPMSVFALNLIIGLGLGLAIDYSLFVVSRFREELERGSGHRGRARRDDADRGSHRAVQRRDGRGGAGLAARVPAAVPVLDGRRRRARDAHRRDRVADDPPGAARRARAARERALAGALARGDAPRGRPGGDAASGTACRAG